MKRYAEALSETEFGIAGYQLDIAELNGRTSTYTYDDLYRLTSETISKSGSTGLFTCGPSQCGAVSYVYDEVGNRKSMTSTLGAIPAGTFFYDANDRFTTDTYDYNGNTVASGGASNTYDFENHLIRHGNVTVVYDGDGNRVKKIVGSNTYVYLNDDAVNPTGYVQVLDEYLNGRLQNSYEYGPMRIAVRRASQVSCNFGCVFPHQYYGYDGHGSVRYLTDNNGTVKDTYDFDAYGNLIASTGTDNNPFLFAGEQYDSDLGLYYNRARYLDVRVGRFWGMDTWPGNLVDPSSLHRYLFASANPVDRVDKSGRADFNLSSSLTAMGSAVTIATMEFQQSLVEAFEEGGGAAGRLFNQMGAYAQEMARKVIQLNPELISEEIEEDVNIAESGVGRQIDFVIRGAQSLGESAKQMLIEAKYALPRVNGPALLRLTRQVGNAIQSGKGQVVIWSLQTPGMQQVRLVMTSLGENANRVQFVSGVQGLYRFLELYFGK